MIKIVGVRFRSAGKVYYFDPKDLQLRMGDHVIAETSKGPEYGIISTCMKMVDEDLVQQPLRSLLRKASPEDEQKIEMLRIKEREALRVCREKVREHELEMKMVDAEYSFDGSKVLFYFTADGRVDFRNLVKDLAGVFHVRIELRQIGVRDETRMLGGIGTCGRELCCATFLREFEPVSIKMAKEQNLSLNPAKISGTCGRLMCCLKNEEATYEYLNARMPKLGEEAITADGQSGKVIELDVLRQRVRVLFEEGDSKEIVVFPVSDLTFKPRKKKDPSQQGKKLRGEKGERPERGEKGARGDRAERPERGEKGARGEGSQREPEASVRTDRSAARREPEASVRTDRSAARREPEASVRTDRSAARREPEASVRRDRSAARREPEASGRTDRSAARREPEAIVRRDRSAARREPVESGRTDRSAARREPEASVRRGRSAARREPGASVRRDRSAARRDPEAIGRRGRSAARREPEASGRRDRSAARREPEASGRTGRITGKKG